MYRQERAPAFRKAATSEDSPYYNGRRGGGPKSEAATFVTCTLWTWRTASVHPPSVTEIIENHKKAGYSSASEPRMAPKKEKKNLEWV